jgi:hypothetical protein
MPVAEGREASSIVVASAVAAADMQLRESPSISQYMGQQPSEAVAPRLASNRIVPTPQ